MLIAEHNRLPEELDRVPLYWLLIMLGYRVRESSVAMTKKDKKDILIRQKRERDRKRNRHTKPPPFKPR